MKEIRLPSENYRNAERVITFNSTGLSEAECAALYDLGLAIFQQAADRFKYALSRCTFFAEYGYDGLERLVDGNPLWTNPRIEGCDHNPFDQHYWLAVDLVRQDSVHPITFDPIFGYVGLLERACDVLDGIHVRYYTESRQVPPHTSRGGVRIKTFGI